MKTLLVISGPTASGKSALALQLACHFQTEIISSDSRQFYSGMDIGTAKPSPQELALIPHHFIDFLNPDENYSTGDFENDVLKLLDQLFLSHELVIMTGGSGLYNKAVTEGLDDLPDANPELREQLSKEFEHYGITALQNKLKELDPEYYAEVDRANPQRLIRAIEVCLQSGKKYSSIRNQPKVERPFQILHVALDPNREILYQRINQRVDQMFDHGLIEEVRKLIPYRSCNALKTVGYQELFQYFDGTLNLEQAKDLIKQNSRNYAKRQMTWLRKEEPLIWCKEKIPEDLLKEVINLLNERGLKK